ncbi:TRAP transporter substrate-binding protein [Desulfogranum mediterraneum]|uniref:TRAP transporter substrate-binding protein n=1 Tax=Desulfogranum mediterraneum TaxID=160661 RepID=UPI0004034D55|nr:TRAP transporter substrate-binding protein [Desulfogranum mediterraneum]
MKHLQLTLSLVLVLLFGQLSLAAQEIKLGVVTKPGSAQNIAAEKFKQLLEQASEGRYTVRIYHSKALGNETEILQQIQMGTVQLGIITVGPFDTFAPIVRVINYPFLFKDNQQADAILDGPLGQQILTELEQVGFKGLAFSENGFRNLTNNRRPVQAAADVSGLKIRVMASPLHKSIWQALGANPTPMPWPIYSELEQGVIDGQENPLWVMEVYKFYEVQNYMSMTRHVYSAHIDVASLLWWQGLTTADQEMIRSAMQQAALFQRQDNRDRDLARLALLREKGMEIVEQPDIDSFRDRVSTLKEMKIYQHPKVQALLRQLLAATR